MFPAEWLLPILLLVLFGVIAILFLPSLLEVKKPKDKGPRRIADTTLEQTVESGQASCNPLIRFIGDKEFPPGTEIKESVVVEGSLTIGDRCVFQKSVKAYGDATVGDDAFIGENLVAEGNVNLGRGTVVNGSIDARGSVTLGENVLVGCSVVAGGSVELRENSEVRMNISANGCIRVVSKPKLDVEPSVLERPTQ